MGLKNIEENDRERRFMINLYCNDNLIRIHVRELTAVYIEETAEEILVNLKFETNGTSRHFVYGVATVQNANIIAMQIQRTFNLYRQSCGY